MVSAATSRSSSATPITPMTHAVAGHEHRRRRRDSAYRRDVRASAAVSASRARETAGRCRTPRATPATRPSAPRPGSARTSVGGAEDQASRSRASADDRRGDRMLGARFDGGGSGKQLGLGDPCCRDARTSRAATPRVSVPVLSNAIARIAASRSRCTPPLTSTPRRAAPASADTIDTGVEITSAHGHETTSSTSAR